MTHPGATAMTGRGLFSELALLRMFCAPASPWPMVALASMVSWVEALRRFVARHVLGRRAAQVAA